MNNARPYLENQLRQGNIWGVFNLFPVGISLALDISCRNVIYNSAYAVFLRADTFETVTRNDQEGPTVRMLQSGRELAFKDQPLQRAAWFGETVKGVELEYTWDDGVAKAAIWSSCPLYDDQGRIIGALATCQDVTGRQGDREKEKTWQRLEELMQERIQELFASEAGRRQLERRLAFLACSGPVAITVSLPGKRLKASYISENILALTGYKPDDFFSSPTLFMKLVHPKDKPLIDAKWEELMNTGEIQMEFRLLCRDARYRWFGMKAALLDGQAGNAAEVIGCWWSIDDRKQAESRAEKALQLSEEILERISDGFYSLDDDWRFTYINPAAEKLGFKPAGNLLGKRLWDVAGKDQPFYDEYHRAKREKIPVSFIADGPFLKKKVEVRAYPTGYGLYVLFRDVTVDEMMQEKMAGLDRLNLVGQLAAGISHEVRNPMTTVRGFLQRFIRKKEYDAHHEIFRLMIEELDRANGIIGEFLSVARQDEPQIERLNLNSIIKQISPLIKSDALVAGKNIVYELMDIPVLLLDGKGIRQIILNLVRNALDATPAGKSVTIKTYVDEESRVVLTVADEGPGIDEKIIDKIGTPFITTKNDGTGLGLAICYGIAARNHAIVDFKTGPAGTTFLVKFPLPSFFEGLKIR